METRELVRQFVQHRDLLYGYVFALTGDHHLSEEVFQEIAVSILTEAARGTAPEDFLRWARGVARHRVADRLRQLASRRQHEVQFERFANAVDRAFDECAPTLGENDRHLQFLRECLTKLSGRVRSMLDLRYRDERSIDEIAAALAWTPASVKVALSRARRALAECVDRKRLLEEGVE